MLAYGAHYSLQLLFNCFCLYGGLCELKEKEMKGLACLQIDCPLVGPHCQIDRLVYSNNNSSA